MDPVSHEFYALKFRDEANSCRGDAFQVLFVKVMQAKYPGDFIPSRPWGNIGDRKNDGYLPSNRQLFQLYAPEVLTRRETEDKMEEDYTGALPHWQAYYDTWTFVHNTRRGVGVPPFITTKLNEFNARNSHILSNHWGCHELEMILLSLDEAKIAGILGWAPSHRTMLGLRAENIAVVLSHIAGRPAGSEVDRSPVPSDKIAANAFSPSTELFLHLGFHKSYMVKRFFDAYYDPSYGDRIASAFREEYRLLRTGGCSPDEIFWRLQKFAGGPTIPETHINEAILAVLAYLFESCDIYERPCSVGAGH